MGDADRRVGGVDMLSSGAQKIYTCLYDSQLH